MMQTDLMDFFTHALLPYLLGSSLNIGKKRLAALVLGGIAPDLDVFVSLISNVYPTSLLLVHRGMMHSLFFGFFFGLLILYLAALPQVRGILGRVIKYDIDLSPGMVALVYTGVVMHLLLDFTTTRGVPLFYPIETLRYSADVFYQIEPIVLVATLLVLTALVRDRSIVRFNKGLFVVFVVFLLVVGGLRFEGKQSALANFSGDNAKAFPESGLFSWAVLENETDRFLVYEYDYLNGNVSVGSVFPRLTVASSLQEAKKAIALAEKLFWVRIFRWRAYSVAINATFTENGSWDIEYYDPLVRVETHDSISLLRLPSKNYGAVRVTVQGKVAKMAE